MTTNGQTVVTLADLHKAIQTHLRRSLSDFPGLLSMDPIPPKRDPASDACFDEWLSAKTGQTFEEWCDVSVTL